MNELHVALMAAAVDAEPKTAKLLRRMAAEDLEAVADRWNDEAAEFALAGNPTRAHQLERWAGGVARAAMWVRAGAPFMRPPERPRESVAGDLGLELP